MRRANAALDREVELKCIRAVGLQDITQSHFISPNPFSTEAQCGSIPSIRIFRPGKSSTLPVPSFAALVFTRHCNLVSFFFFFSVSAWCNFSPAASPSAWPYEQLRSSVVARESCLPRLCLPVAVSQPNGQLLVSEALSWTISRTSETIPTCRRHR